VSVRLAQLELTLFEVVTALGVLVGHVAATQDEAELTAAPDLVREALERAWETLFESGLIAAGLGSAPLDRRDVVPDWAARSRLFALGPDALREAMNETGAAVGALYAISFDDGAGTLVSSEGSPAETIDRFSLIDPDLPVAAAARTGQPQWLSLGPDLQGAVVPLIAGNRVAAVVSLGFACAGHSPSLTEARWRIVRAVTTAPAE